MGRGEGVRAGTLMMSGDPCSTPRTAETVQSPSAELRSHRQTPVCSSQRRAKDLVDVIHINKEVYDFLSSACATKIRRATRLRSYYPQDCGYSQYRGQNWCTSQISRPWCFWYLSDRHGAEINVTTLVFPVNDCIYNYLVTTKRKDISDFTRTYTKELYEDKGARYPLIEITFPNSSHASIGLFTPNLATPIFKFSKAIKAN